VFGDHVGWGFSPGESLSRSGHSTYDARAMADIVLSYARENRQQAESLAGALEDAGWSVWWDRAILPGVSYEQVIEAELSAARCVVVLWSAAARQSNWVRDEATLALSRNVLVSGILDASEPPLGFRQQQTANLEHWDGSATDPAFALLTQGIAKVMAREGSHGVPPAPVVTRPAKSSKRRSAAVIALVMLGSFLAGGGAVIWSTGYLGSGTESAPRDGSPAPRNTRNSTAPRKNEPVAPSQALLVPARASLMLPRENVTLTILSGALERVNADTRALTLHIRVSNSGTRSFYRTYHSSLRLIIDGVPRAPTDSPSEQVEKLSAREFDYRFDVPAAATRAVLRLIHDDQTAEIPLDLTPPGR